MPKTTLANMGFVDHKTTHSRVPTEEASKQFDELYKTVCRQIEATGEFLKSCRRVNQLSFLDEFAVMFQGFRTILKDDDEIDQATLFIMFMLALYRGGELKISQEGS